MHGRTGQRQRQGHGDLITVPPRAGGEGGTVINSGGGVKNEVADGVSVLRPVLLTKH